MTVNLVCWSRLTWWREHSDDDVGPKNEITLQKSSWGIEEKDAWTQVPLSLDGGKNDWEGTDGFMGTLLLAILKLMNLGGVMIDEPDALRLRDEQFPVVDNIV